MFDWCFYVFCCFKQKTAYELRISDWSSDVCSSDLLQPAADTRRALRCQGPRRRGYSPQAQARSTMMPPTVTEDIGLGRRCPRVVRSEERRVGKECVSTCRSLLSRYT